jgi:hypothetical protein
MVNTRTVVLYGRSLVVTGLAACLADRPHLTLHHLDATTPDLALQIRMLAPDVLVFDLAAAHPDYAIALLREHPRLLLIGVDVVHARTLVLSGQQTEALTIDDLEHVIAPRPAQEDGPGAETHPQGG